MRALSALTLAALLGACGGSTSETPPPLPPLSPSAAVPATSGEGDAHGPLVPEDRTEDDVRRPRPTWGAGAPSPR